MGHDDNCQSPKNSVARDGVAPPESSEQPPPALDLPHLAGSSNLGYSTTMTFQKARGTGTFDPGLPAKLDDRYEFHSLLGIGGFGAVYEASDELLSRRVAIKIARSDRFDQTRDRQRFIDEARAAARLKHPNVVTVFDSGIAPDGSPFVVFELVSGLSLSERIKLRPLSQQEAIRLVILVASAVHAAHKQGLVHRDLKPSNILLDAQDCPHVGDFGLAVDEDSQRNLSGEIAGSPHYMSPEQVRGETHYLDGRTDIWSLGVILYQLLTRRLPFNGRDVTEIHNEILNREPKPLRQIDDSIPVPLEQVCLKCLRKQISERWSSAAEFADTLNSFVTHQVESSPPVPVGAPHRISTIVTVLIAAVLVFYAAFAIQNRIPDQQAKINAPPLSPADAGHYQPAEPMSTATPAQVPGAVPVPGKWFPLLSRQPVYLVWPSDEQNSKREYAELSRELWLTCRGSGLVKLGETSGDYELQLRLHQLPWTGNVGLFFGLREEADSTGRNWAYQCLELACPRDRRGDQVFLKRVKISRREKLMTSRVTFTASQLPILPNRDVTLFIRVANSRLATVQWNGVDQPLLVAESLDTEFQPVDQQGVFGVFVDDSSVVIRHPELLIPLELNQ